MSTPQMVTLGKELFKLKAKKKKLEEDVKVLNAKITEIEAVKLPKLMEDAEVPSFKITGGGTIYLQDQLYVNVLAEDRPKLYEELRATGNGDMIQDWVFPNTLKAFCKEQLGAAKALPTVVKATFIPTAMTRSK